MRLKERRFGVLIECVCTVNLRMRLKERRDRGPQECICLRQQGVSPSVQFFCAFSVQKRHVVVIPQLTVLHQPRHELMVWDKTAYCVRVTQLFQVKRFGNETLCPNLAGCCLLRQVDVPVIKPFREDQPVSIPREQRTVVYNRYAVNIRHDARKSKTTQERKS